MLSLCRFEHRGTTMGKIFVPALPTAMVMERYLKSRANDQKSASRGALDLDVSHIDMRAKAYGVRITDVSIDGEAIGVSYEVDYSVYNGCNDMDIDDSEEGFVEGVLTDGGWEFEEFIPPPKRTTLDEF